MRQIPTKDSSGSEGTRLSPRYQTKVINIGGVKIGGGNAVAIQSMLTTDTSDVKLCLAQIKRLQEAGCELIRLAVANSAVLNGFAQICAESALPVIADIHFDAKLALAAVKCGAAKLRINPGNIGSLQAMDAILDACGSADIPIRIGVNAGSLAPEFANQTNLTFPEKLAASAQLYSEYCESRGFTSLVVSAKAHDVQTTVAAYRLLAARLPKYPLHLGVTEAGTTLQGTVKSAIGIGALLLDGIGDTLRVSLTADPVEEVRVAWELLAALGMRRRHPELVSCPTCARCKVDLIAIAEKVNLALQDVRANLSVAVMGCIVNGPGEA
jgi:(E)-4-hydroxy-3-methylbut-2-enyl-diphosphate synthase